MAHTDPSFVAYAIRDHHGNLLPGLLRADQAQEGVAQLDAFFKKNAPHELLEVHRPTERPIGPRADALAMLRSVLGCISNDSHQVVAISQDEATGSVTVKVGNAHTDPQSRKYTGGGLGEALLLAYQGEHQ